MTLGILVLGALLTLNFWATRRVLRSDEDGFRKKLFIAGIWVAPFFGALMVKNVGGLRQVLEQDTAAKRPASAPLVLQAPTGETFDLAAHMRLANGVPLLDWAALAEWSSREPDPASRAEARAMGRHAWLLHLGEALGSHFHLMESSEAWLLSSLDERSGRVLLDYVTTTRKRVHRLLDGVARFPAGEKSIIVVLDDEETYYHYVAIYYPDEGDFAFSGGMFIDAGCPHFVAKRADIAAVEPVVAHELTHSALAYLALPLWLDEGIAVNTERRLAGVGPSQYTAHEMHEKHLHFWDTPRIQEFWSGSSFQRTDDGNMLSYDLARILVEKMSGDWPSFAAFVGSARREDAGASAALNALSVDLGAWVCALFGREPDSTWTPAPVPAQALSA